MRERPEVHVCIARHEESVWVSELEEGSGLCVAPSAESLLKGMFPHTRTREGSIALCGRNNVNEVEGKMNTHAVSLFISLLHRRSLSLKCALSLPPIGQYMHPVTCTSEPSARIRRPANTYRAPLKTKLLAYELSVRSYQIHPPLSRNIDTPCDFPIVWTTG